MFVYSHNFNSVGAKELGRALKAQRIKHENSSFVGGSNKTVINWGSQSLPPEVLKCQIINAPAGIALVSNKKKFFQLIATVPALNRPTIPRFTTSVEEAKAWAIQEKTLLVARTVLNGSGGEGIKFVDYNEKDSFVEAPLYVEYIKKKDEYRVHFVAGEIVDFQRKALRPGVDPHGTNWKVRNLENGFIYVRGNVELPEDVKIQAQKTIACCGLDFGAIDIIYNENSKKAYVLEINSAPGLQGETVKNYADAINKNWGNN